jgi:hypothetical protein
MMEVEEIIEKGKMVAFSFVANFCWEKIYDVDGKFYLLKCSPVDFSSGDVEVSEVEKETEMVEVIKAWKEI